VTWWYATRFAVLTYAAHATRPHTGYCCEKLSETDQAKTHFEAAVARSETIANATLEASALIGLGTCLRKRGEHVDAKRYVSSPVTGGSPARAGLQVQFHGSPQSFERPQLQCTTRVIAAGPWPLHRASGMLRRPIESLESRTASLTKPKRREPAILPWAGI
jgi:hypothetical protein